MLGAEVLALTTGGLVSSSRRADTEGGGAAVSSQRPRLLSQAQRSAGRAVRHQGGGRLGDVGRCCCRRRDLLTAVEHLAVTLLAIEVQAASVLRAVELSLTTVSRPVLLLVRAVTEGGGAAVSSQAALGHLLAQSLTLGGEGGRAGQAGGDQPEQSEAVVVAPQHPH